MPQSTNSSESKKKSKRARLGRGLGALIDQGAAPRVSVDVGAKQSQETVQTANMPGGSKDTGHSGLDDPRARVFELAVGEIVPNPNQPRRVFDEQALSALADSILAHGLMQPIVVRASENGGGYELIAGERRWRAAKLAGLDTVRAVISSADDEQSAQLALIENIQRADLNPIERAMGFAQLIERFGLTQQRLADRMGMSRPAVANLMRLLELDADLQEHIGEGTLSIGHGKVLLGCPDPEQRKRLAAQCIAEGWTVRLLESKLTTVETNRRKPDTITSSQAPSSDRVSSVLQDMERRMSEQLGTRVALQTNRKGNKGRIVIDFYDLDQFDGLLERLGIAGEDASV